MVIGGLMFELFKPNSFYPTIYDIEIEKLKNAGIKGLIIDIDNTLAPWKADFLEEKVKKWLIKTKSMGLKVCFVSNGHKKRIKNLVIDLDIPYIYQAQKPARRGFLRALKILETKPFETALIGDQIFTDILGGNRLGLTTILVEPIDRSYEFFTTKLLRYLEKVVFKRTI
jgi:uncharacterized protein